MAGANCVSYFPNIRVNFQNRNNPKILGTDSRSLVQFQIQGLQNIKREY
jgi:hypothetical protein